MTESIDDSLHYLRDALMRTFNALSAEKGVDISPNKDIVVLDVCERLYDEEKDGRRIYIDLNPDSSLELDWFLKEFPHQGGSASLLTISIDGRKVNNRKLWSIYKGWMHDRLDADIAVKL